MNFKIINIILALLIIELKVFSFAINDIVSKGKVKTTKALDTEVPTELTVIDVEDTDLEPIEDSDSEDSDTAIDVEDTDLEPIEDSDSEDSDTATDSVNINENSELEDLKNYINWTIENGLLGSEDGQVIIAEYQNKSKNEILQQKFDAINYGTKVEVNGYQMSVNISGKQHNQTIVLLPALGVLSPVLFYKGLVENLATDYKVITIEPFGYGISDIVEEERTVDNIIPEIHTCLEKLGIDKFYFMGHSIGGIYSLVYSDQYPDEVLGFIGLDNTPNNYANFAPIERTELDIKFLEGHDKYHIWRYYPEEVKKIYIESQMDPNYNYTDKDMEDFDLIFSFRNINTNSINENEVSKYNVDYAEDMKFQCPILMFVSSVTNSTVEPKWISMHEDMISNHENSEMIILEEPHFIIHSNHAVISDKIKEWIL